MVKNRFKGNRKNIREYFWGCAVFLLLIVYLSLFAYLNMAKYNQHVDSDIAAEALWAREIWTQKTLTPDDWIVSTKRYVFGMPTIAALFYGLTGSMTMAAGMACVLVGAVLAGVFYWFLRWIGLSRTASLAGLLALCAVPVNGLRNEGQMVPFVMLLLFLFAGYYALHSILAFLAIGFYLHLRRGKIGRGTVGAWILLGGFALLMCFEGQRCLQLLILPMAAAEAVMLFTESKGFSAGLSSKRLLAAGFPATLLLAYALSCLYKGQVDYPMYLQTPQDTVKRLLVTVPGAILEGFGIAGGVRAGSFASLMQMLVWAFLALVGYGLFLLFRKERRDEEQRMAVGILVVSLGGTALIVALTTAEPAHNYFFFSWYIAVIVVGWLVDKFRKTGAWFGDLILLSLCVFALLNLRYTYADSVMTRDNLKEYEEVADFLIEEGVEYGYAEFWDAGRISLVRDGAVTMGHSYAMEDLEMYWWLTSLKWYPPSLQEEMRTAYVVRNAKKEAFESQFGTDGGPELRFENDRFAVYIGDVNYMKMY